LKILLPFRKVLELINGARKESAALPPTCRHTGEIKAAPDQKGVGLRSERASLCQDLLSRPAWPLTQVDLELNLVNSPGN
jgi:hypothetical protein